MEAPFKLSRSQILCLESLFLFLHTLKPLLLSVSSEVFSLATRAQLDSMIELAAKREADLIANFLEVRAAAERWKLAGGGQ